MSVLTCAATLHMYFKTELAGGRASEVIMQLGNAVGAASLF